MGEGDLLAVTHSRYPADRRDDAYTRSYRTIRVVVGFLGILLPLILIIGEAYFLRGGVHVRGSLSEYYHTSMQDIFVGVLCVIGFLLATYMAGEARTLDFAVSLAAGIAVLGVVFFPTARTGLPPGAPPCESHPTPSSCSIVEQSLGEHETAVVHAVCATVFIVCLAVMSLLFALSQVVPEAQRHRGATGQQRLLHKPTVFWIHATCASLILLAGAWVIAGQALHATIWQLTPLYVGEVVSVWAFGVSWLLAGFAVTAPARPEADLLAAVQED